LPEHDQLATTSAGRRDAAATTYDHER
jgi:hypothetical protein